jgi:GABA(A) receptor-associated protein
MKLIPNAPGSKHELESRIAESNRIKEKYPDRIPVICEKAPKSGLPSIGNKKKFLVPADVTIASFIYVVRKRMTLEADQALFMFVSALQLSYSDCLTRDQFSSGEI